MARAKKSRKAKAAKGRRKPRRFKCPICGRRFTSKHGLSLHIRVHQREAAPPPKAEAQPPPPPPPPVEAPPRPEEKPKKRRRRIVKRDREVVGFYTEKTEEGEKKVKPITAPSGKPRRVKVKVKEAEPKPPAKVEQPRTELLEAAYKPWENPKVLRWYANYWPDEKMLKKVPPERRGRLIAPFIDWDSVEKRYMPPPPGTVEYLDYPHPDAPDGVIEELKWAFRLNRKYVCQGKDPVNVMLLGPPGTGKTAAVKKFASEMGLPYYYIPADARYMTAEQLLGRKELERLPDGTMRTVWKDGTIVQAARTGGVLHIDEFSLLDPEVATRLHELLDSQRRLSLEGITGEVIKAHPDLFIVVTFNPIELGTEHVKPISGPLFRRFRGILMDYPPPEIELKIIKTQLGLSDKELKVRDGNVEGKYAEPLTRLVKALHDIRGEAERGGEIVHIPTLSEAIEFARELKEGTDVKRALHRAIIGKYCGLERRKIEESLRYQFPELGG